MTITGNTLIVMYVTFFYRKLWSGAYAVIMLMSVVEGYIADYLMSVAELAEFFAGHARKTMPMIVVRCGFSIEIMTMDGLQHTYHLPNIVAINAIYTAITVYAGKVKILHGKHNINKQYI